MRPMPAAARVPSDDFLRHRGLIALTVGGAIVEACLLTLLAPDARPLAPQVTAVPPLAVFHDLRWLFGSGWAWPGFAASLAAIVLARSAVSTAAILLAWPRGAARPPAGVVFGRCVTFTVIVGLLLAPVVTLVLGVSMVPFSWPFLAALPALLMIMISLAHSGVSGAWWRVLPSARAVGWLLANFLALSAAAAAIAHIPAWAGVPVAGLAGVANARAWFGVTAAAARRVPSRSWPRGRAWPAPVAPLAAAVAIALVIGVARLIFAVNAHAPQAAGQAGATPGAGSPGAGGRAHAVLVIPGFGSTCCRPSATLGRFGPRSLVRPFSYRGLGRDGRPLPYGPTDTDLSLRLLGDRVAAQVRALHARTGREVDIVAESEGTLAVDAMLAMHPSVPVDSVVLLSPIVDPDRTGYPPSAGGGPGPVSGRALTAMVSFVARISPYGPAGAKQLIGSVSSEGAAVSTAASARRLRILTVVPLADALTLPACTLPPGTIVVPAFHGGLLGNPRVDRMVRAFFTNSAVSGLVSGQRGLAETAEVLASASSAWRMPETAGVAPACGG